MAWRRIDDKSLIIWTNPDPEGNLSIKADVMYVSPVKVKASIH